MIYLFDKFISIFPVDQVFTGQSIFIHAVFVPSIINLLDDCVGIVFSFFSLIKDIKD